MISTHPDRWGIVLAGGDGCRLRSLTKRIAGFELPKQFCPVLSSKPMVQETLERISPLIVPSQTLISLNREHRRYYSPMFRDTPQVLIEAPSNRGTAPAILQAVMRIHDRAPKAIVGLFPSDHYIGNQTRFVEHLNSAFDAAREFDDTVLLLGVHATAPEQAYGWIVPEISMAVAGGPVKSVRRFVEKPDWLVAYELWQAGALWNTMILVGRASAFLRLFRTTMPNLYASFVGLCAMPEADFEREELERLYGNLSASSFSEVVLQQVVANLLVMPIRDVEWCDLGDPVRVLEVARQIGVSLKWAAA